MAGMLVLTTMQPIVGVDLHNSLPPIPVEILPHYVIWSTGLSLGMGLGKALTASKAMSPKHPDLGKNPIAVGPGHACGRGHDAGVHFGHIAANTLLAIIWLGAASKAEFGSGTVRVQGQRMAVNMMLFMNLQLNCGDPLPMPTGVTFATSSAMVYANMTFADLFNGFVHMLVDIVIVAVLNFLLGTAAIIGARVMAKAGMTGILSELACNASEVRNKLDDIFLRKLSNGKRVIEWSRLTPRGFAKQIKDTFYNHWWNLADYNTDVAPKALGDAAKGVLPGYLFGSPVGASASSHVSLGSAIVGNHADNGIDSLFYP